MVSYPLNHWRVEVPVLVRVMRPALGVLWVRGPCEIRFVVWVARSGWDVPPGSVLGGSVSSELL